MQQIIPDTQKFSNFFFNIGIIRSPFAPTVSSTSKTAKVPSYEHPFLRRLIKLFNSILGYKCEMQRTLQTSYNSFLVQWSIWFQFSVQHPGGEAMSQKPNSPDGKQEWVDSILGIKMRTATKG